MDGEDATASEFQERLDMLKANGDPIFFRYEQYNLFSFTEPKLVSS